MVRHRRSILALAAGLALLVLAGCEFPGAGASVSFTSHKDGQRIIGGRTVAVTGTVSGGTVTAFALTLNGSPVPGASLSGSSFSGKVTLEDGSNTLVASAKAAGVTATATLYLVYPFLALQDGQVADTVMGQPGMTSSTASTTVQRVDHPTGPPALVGGRLYLPDTGNNRVVGYSSVPASDNQPFDYLLGHSDFTTRPAEPIGARSLNAPAGVADAAGDLLAVDTGNSRVLLYSGAPTITHSAAAVAVGQASLYSTPTTPCTSDHLDHPGAAVVAGGRLIVADSGHNRVMIWNSVPTTSGTPADLILGRSDCTAGTTSATTLSAPEGVWSDGTRLLVADTGNNRVLLWTAFPTATHKAAEVVIGQATMSGSGVHPANDSAAAATVHTGLNAPRGVDSNGNQIFVADTGYNRVLVFDSFPSLDGAHASRVLGHTSLGGTAADDGGIGAGTLDHPGGVRAFDAFLVVADTGNSRELLYRRP